MEDITIKTNLNSALGPGLRGVGGAPAASQTEEAGKPFIASLKESLQEVNELQKDADQAIEALVTGSSQNVHEAMLAVSKADLAFRMTMQVRNKIVEAYQEVMRMQI